MSLGSAFTIAENFN